MEIKLATPTPVDSTDHTVSRIKIGSPVDPAAPSALEIAQKREALANELRNNYPGEWAEVSRDHVSRGSARQVRDRIKGRECWMGFEWAVRKQEDNPNLHVIYAKAPGGEEVEVPVEVRTVTLDQISPTF